MTRDDGLSPIGLCSAAGDDPGGGGGAGGGDFGEPAGGQDAGGAPGEGGGAEDAWRDADDGREPEQGEGGGEAEAARAELGALTEGLGLSVDIEAEAAKLGATLDVAGTARLLRSVAQTGLKGAKLDRLVKDYLEHEGGRFAAAQEAALMDATTADTTIRELRQDWGKDFDGNLAAAQAAFRDLAAGDFEQLDGLRLDDGSRLSDHPAVASLFWRAHQRLTAATPAAMPPASGSVPAAPAAAGAAAPDLRRQIDEIAADPRFRDTGHPMYKHLVADWNRLNEALAALEPPDLF